MAFPGASFEGVPLPPGIGAPGLEGIEAQPPGLWQAHGLAGTGGTSSSRGMAHGVAASDLQNEVAATMEGTVQRLIQAARQSTEARVKAELKQIVDIMMAMDARFDQLLAALENMGPPKATEAALDIEQVGSLLTKIDQQWEQEMRTLKQELHQTILAHNHNADLIKHHKDTIDAMQEKCTKRKNNNVRSSEVQQQLLRLDARLKQQQKQRKLEPLYERIAALEQKVAAAQQAAYNGYSGIIPIMPPVALPDHPPGMLPPGVGPPNVGLIDKGAPGASPHKPAAYRCPTDEELQARLSKLAQPRTAGIEATETSPEATEREA